MFSQSEMPKFESEIPEPLLASATPEMRWIMESMSEVKQQNKWMAKELSSQSTALAQVIELQKITNGRVNKAEAKMQGYDSHIEGCPVKQELFKKQVEKMNETNKTMEAISLGKKILSTKWGSTVAFGIFSCILFFYIFLYNHVPMIPAILEGAAKLFGLL